MKTSGSLFALVLYVAMIVGYIKCVVNLIQCDFEPSYKAEIIYGFGCVTGAGSIIGYLDLGE